MPAPLEHTMLAVTFEHHSSGVLFEKVPPHISVMPWFDASGLNVEEITQDYRESVEPFTVFPAEEKTYGGNGHNKPGRRVDSGNIVWFHRSLYPLLVRAGVRFSHPEWLWKGYEPHYTFQNGVDPLRGEVPTLVSELAVIVNQPNAEGGETGLKKIEYLRFGE